MPYEHKQNSGSLFKNKRKEQDSHPDYKGEGRIDGIGDVWINAWINDGKNGKYMALKFTPKS